MNYSSLLLNPNTIDFFLDEKEVTLFVEAKKNLFKGYYSKTLKLIWEAVINNLKRRVNAYGTYEFIKNLEEDEKIKYFKMDDSTSKKVELLNNLVFLKNCLKLQIINKKTFTIIDFYYSFSKNCDISSLKKEEINSFMQLLEINLFKIPIEKRNKELASSFILNEFTKIEIEELKKEYTNIKNDKTYSTNEENKRLKKEDILMMHYSNNSNDGFYPLLTTIKTPRRRREDRLYSLFPIDIDENEKRKFFYRRRKTDH